MESGQSLSIWISNSLGANHLGQNVGILLPRKARISLSSPLYFISGCKTWIIQILNEFLNVLSLTQPETVKSETPLLFGQSKSKRNKPNFLFFSQPPPGLTSVVFSSLSISDATDGPLSDWEHLFFLAGE